MTRFVLWFFNLFDRWLDPVPLHDLSSTETLLREGRQQTDMDIESDLAERFIQDYDRVNPYV